MDAPVRDTVQHYRSTLIKAIAECRLGTLAWARLIGAQYPGLGWWVIDERDGTEHHPTAITRGRTSNGKADQAASRLFD